MEEPFLWNINLPVKHGLRPFFRKVQECKEATLKPFSGTLRVESPSSRA